MIIKKGVRFYHNKGLIGAKVTESDSLEYLGCREFNADEVPLSVSYPEDCNYFESYAIVYDEIEVDGKKVKLSSERLYTKGYDFEIAIKNELPQSIYIAVVLKNMEVVIFENDNEAKAEHYITYHKILHPEFDEVLFVQRPKELDLKYVKIPQDCRRFEMFDKYVKFVEDRGRGIKLESEKENHKNYYIGYLTEATKNYRNFKTEDGQEWFAVGDDVIFTPKQFDKYGRLNLKYSEFNNLK